MTVIQKMFYLLSITFGQRWGTHEAGMKAAMTKSYNEYARKVGLLKERDKNLEGSDFREGLAAVLSIRVPENLLQFEGQTKKNLVRQLLVP